MMARNKTKHKFLRAISTDSTMDELDAFFEHVKTAPGAEQELLELLEEAVSNEDKDSISVCIIAALGRPRICYLQILHRIMDDFFSELYAEDLVTLLGRVGSEASISRLKGLFLREYDFTEAEPFWVMYKAIDSLCRIGTEEAISVIKFAAKNCKDVEYEDSIADYAKETLKLIGESRGK